MLQATGHILMPKFGLHKFLKDRERLSKYFKFETLVIKYSSFFKKKEERNP